MDSQEKKQLNLFREEIKKHEVIDGMMITSLMFRFVAPLHKRRFFSDQHKMKYYSSYWYKILVKEGTLIPTMLGYKVNKREVAQ